MREFDERLRSFKQNSLRGGSLSFATDAFAEDFGADVARFFQDVARDPNRAGLLNDVLAGSSMLRKHFSDAPAGAERVVMEVVSNLILCVCVSSRFPHFLGGGVMRTFPGLC